ncbi:mitochondrial export protein Som1 [Phaeosphaeriaceae sp. PMI808]|nr:mitochondrial export protein Som1 [Phaeosphaeriaceae sp. PMI808]
MSPPLPIYPLSALETQVNIHPDGKARKPLTKLVDCPLKELVQYKCNIKISKTKNVEPMILCEPVVRLLRQCENGMSVETTAWEGWKAQQQK